MATGMPFTSYGNFGQKAPVNPSWAPPPSVDPRAAQRANDASSIFGLGTPEQAGNSFYGGGYKGLMDLINNPGRTDNRAFNMSLTANDRATGAQMGGARGRAASGLMQNSGLAMALQNAIGRAGQARGDQLTSAEAARREGLRRDDTQLLNEFIQQPRLDRYAFDKGIASSQGAANAQKKQNAVAGASALVGLIAAAACHVADELYGELSENAILSRYYMAAHAEPATFETYNFDTSKRLAERMKDDPALRDELRPIFDSFVERAKQDFERYR